MTKKRFYLENDEWVKYEFSEIREYVDEKHTSFPLRNDELCKLLNGLHEENQRLRNKLNLTALELVDETISMGKAVEISEMNYHEFLEYRQKKGKPMELQI